MKKIIIVGILFFIIVGGVFAESEALNQITTKLIEYVENAEAFLTEQTPEYIEQLLAYKTAANKKLFYVDVIFTIIFLVLAGISFFRECPGWCTGFAIVGAIWVFIAIDCHLALLKIELAPKVYILEYLTSLGKGI